MDCCEDGEGERPFVRQGKKSLMDMSIGSDLSGPWARIRWGNLPAGERTGSKYRMRPPSPDLRPLKWLQSPSPSRERDKGERDNRTERSSPCSNEEREGEIPWINDAPACIC